MLVLTRRIDQKIHLGADIVITILKIKGSSVRIGIEAPSEVKVWRAELIVGGAAPGDRHDERPEAVSASTTQAAPPVTLRDHSTASEQTRLPRGQARRSASRPSAGSPRRRGSSSRANDADARALGRGPASAADGFSAATAAEVRDSAATSLAVRTGLAVRSAAAMHQ